MKNKSFLILILVCLIALTAIVVGVAYVNKQDSREETDQLLDINDAYDKVAMDTREASTGESKVVSSMRVTKRNTEKKTEKEHTTEPVTEKNETTTEPARTAGNDVAEFHFSSNDIMLWPVDGEVIMEYNMENTVYFKTLNQYKCSPAIAIQSDLNTEVHAAAAGRVSEVGTNEEIGNYVVVSMGDGYELTYGQLKDIQVEKGDILDERSLVGYINNPTKYYSKEGYNLYLKLTVNGKPEDPLDYLNY